MIRSANSMALFKKETRVHIINISSPLELSSTLELMKEIFHHSLPFCHLLVGPSVLSGAGQYCKHIV